MAEARPVSKHSLAPALLELQDPSELIEPFPQALVALVQVSLWAFPGTITISDTLSCANERTGGN